MKVPYAKVRNHYPDVDSITQAELYQWIGYPEHIDHPHWENTCAIRLSLALLGAGFPDPGVYPVKAGRYKGRRIETMQKALSKYLVRQLGEPEKYTNGLEAEKKIDTRHGIISFFQLYGPTSEQGHIAIVAKGSGMWGIVRCGREGAYAPTGCYWSSVEVWFWPLP